MIKDSDSLHFVCRNGPDGGRLIQQRVNFSHPGAPLLHQVTKMNINREVEIRMQTENLGF